MRENQLPLHYTSIEESGRVRPAVNSSDGGVVIPRARVTRVEAKSVRNYLADDLRNSVQITLVKRVIKPGSDKAMCLAAQSIPISDDEISSVSNVGLKLADDTKVASSLSFFSDEAAQNVTPMRGAEPPTHFSAAGSASAASAVAVAPRALPGPRNHKLGTWLLASAVISVTTLYTICNPKWVPSFVHQTVKVSKQLSADIKRRAGTALGGTAVTDTAKTGAGTVASAAGIQGAPTGCNPVSAFEPQGETPIHGVIRNSVTRGVRPAAPASLRDVDSSAAQHHGCSGAQFMVPPPPPTPCVLPPEFGSFLMQPAQQQAPPQQQLQQAQAQASPNTHNQAAALENTPQQSDQDLQAADQELQAALHSSLVTVDEWKR
jgi:hypothetical protein